MDILSSVQGRLKEEITALRCMFYSMDEATLSSSHREYLETLLRSSHDETKAAAERISGYQGIIFAIFGISYFCALLLQTISPECSDVLTECHEGYLTLPGCECAVCPDEPDVA